MARTVNKYLVTTGGEASVRPPASAASLANETISDIFRLLHDVDPPLGEPSLQRWDRTRLDNFVEAINTGGHCLSTLSVTHTDLGWLKVTHVCRDWRAVAFGDSFLWVNIPLTLGPTWAREFIVRSGSQLTRVALDTKFEPWMGNFLRDIYSRTRVLDIHYESSRLADDATCALASLPCTSLEQLIMRKPWYRFECFAWLDVFRAPQMHTLTLKLPFMNADVFPWHGLRTPNIKHLTLGLARSIQDPVVLDHYLSAMQKLSNLVTLDLRFGDAEPTRLSDIQARPTPSIDPHVHWGHLERMYLSGKSHVVMPLLNRLEHPPSADVSWDITERPRLAAVLPFIAARATATAFKTAVLEDLHPYDHDVHLAVLASATKGSHSRAKFSQPASFSFYVDKETSGTLSDLLLACGSNTIEGVILSLTRGVGTFGHQWLPLLRNVTYASVAPGRWVEDRVSSTSSLARVLRQLLVPQVSDGNIARSFFPNLVVLDISCMGMRELAGRCVSREDPCPRLMPPTFAHFLGDILRQRRELGIPIRHVHISKDVSATSKFEQDILCVLQSLEEVVFIG